MKASPNVGPRALLRWCRSAQAEMVQWIRQAVEIESPSREKLHLDRMCDFLAGAFEAAGGKARVLESAAGNHLQVEFAAARRSPAKPVLLVAHHDTVWPLGTLREMPFRIHSGRIWGPGTLDMKGGLAQILFALRALRETGGMPRPVTVLSVSDEEVGSHSSRALTEKLARRSAAVLVMEPAQGLHGALKTARKGVGEYRVKVHGKAAHAGVDFASGGSAIVELARQIQAIAGFTELARGITANPGVVNGGTRSNVIAAEAEAVVDIRIRKPGDAQRVARKFRALKPFDRRCKIEISGGLNRPPMVRSRGVAALFAQARTLAAQMEPGWKLEEAATGGASDGNFTAALGIPTLDGLGAVGGGAHAKHESALVAELPRHAALIAALIAEI